MNNIPDIINIIRYGCRVEPGSVSSDIWANLIHDTLHRLLHCRVLLYGISLSRIFDQPRLWGTNIGHTDTAMLNLEKLSQDKIEYRFDSEIFVTKESTLCPICKIDGLYNGNINLSSNWIHDRMTEEFIMLDVEWPCTVISLKRKLRRKRSGPDWSKQIWVDRIIYSNVSHQYVASKMKKKPEAGLYFFEGIARILESSIEHRQQELKTLRDQLESVSVTGSRLNGFCKNRQ